MIDNQGTYSEPNNDPAWVGRQRAIANIKMAANIHIGEAALKRKASDSFRRSGLGKYAREKYIGGYLSGWHAYEMILTEHPS